MHTTTRTEQRTSRKTTHASKKARPGKSPEERAAEVEALAEQLTAAVTELTTSEAWLSMLRIAAKFTRYSPSNVLLLWMQAEQRGVTLSRVAGYRTWQALGRQVVKGARSFAVKAPVQAQRGPGHQCQPSHLPACGFAGGGGDPGNGGGGPRPDP